MQVEFVVEEPQASAGQAYLLTDDLEQEQSLPLPSPFRCRPAFVPGALEYSQRSLLSWRTVLKERACELLLSRTEL